MRGPKPKLDRPKQCNIFLPSSVYDALVELWRDPFLGEVPKGRRSKEFEAMARRYLKEHSLTKDDKEVL
jgi:hypothetical protein